MSSLSDKLRSLGVQVGADNLPSNNKGQEPKNLIDVLPGRWESTPHGETFTVEKVYPAGHSIGKYPLSPPSSLEPISKWVGDAKLRQLPIEKFAYMDTETTGLSGGTGTYTFLVGVGYFQDGEFKLKQFFLRDPGEESAQLSALESFLAPISALVSYNGKAFDLPRLKTRYIHHHWPPPFQNTTHVDLLHLSRRLWKSHLSSCTLGDIEYHILGFERTEEDVPGWQISDLFFDYLQTQNPLPLRRIFYHNEMDVLSMVALFHRIITLLNNPNPENVDHPGEMLSIGEFYADIGELDRAKAVLDKTLENGVLEPNLRQQAIQSLSFIHKRQGDYHPAVRLWKEAAKHGQIYAHLELAKYFEHREKAYQEAIHWTLSAMSLVDEGDSATAHKDSSLCGDLKYRLDRLKKKIS